MKPMKSKVSITLDEDVIIKIKELSENDDRSFSQYINMVLKEYILKMESTSKWPFMWSPHNVFIRVSTNIVTKNIINYIFPLIPIPFVSQLNYVLHCIYIYIVFPFKL